MKEFNHTRIDFNSKSLSEEENFVKATVSAFLEYCTETKIPYSLAMSAATSIFMSVLKTGIMNDFIDEKIIEEACDLIKAETNQVLILKKIEDSIK